MPRNLKTMIAITLAMFGIVSSLHARPPRFVAKLADGKIIEGAYLADWHSTQSPPKLENQPLFAPNQPLRWLRDRWLMPPDEPEAYVELINGDRVPGRVVRFGGTNNRRFDAQPPHAVVQPAFEQLPPAGVSVTEIRVVLEFVRRIVWQPSSQTVSGDAAVFRDGRVVSFRSIRMMGNDVDLLTDEGPRRFAIGDLAQIQWNETSPWDGYFSELAVLTPDGASRLLQVETTDGLIATTSLERFDARAEGNSSDFSRWVHAVQPAWSLDAIWVPQRNTWMRRSFAAHEVPLTRFRPRSIAAASSSVESQSAPWQVNRNVLGQLLRPGDEEAGWGIGVQSESRLAFPIHDSVRIAHTRFGLDRAAGRGGCVRAKLSPLDKPDQPWFTTDFVVGSQRTVDFGAVAIPASPNRPAELLLHVEAAHHGRPAGADPLTIRDFADWVEPWLELDVESIKSEITRRRGQGIAAWNGWQVAGIESTAARRVNLVDDLANPTLKYRPGIVAAGEPLVLRQQRSLNPRDRWLVIGAYRTTDGANPPKISVRINGETAADVDISVMDRGRRDTTPICVEIPSSVKNVSGPAEIEVQQVSEPNAAPVVWRHLGFSFTRPTLRCLFDEPPQAVAAANMPTDVESTAILVDDANLMHDKPQNGETQLHVGAMASATMKLREPLSVRSSAEWGEFRFLRFAMRKPAKGTLSLIIHRSGGAPPITYLAGKKIRENDTRRVVWQNPVSNDWIVITRDLFADLGACEIESITLESTDEHPAEFDVVYLGRSPSDLDRIPRVAASVK